MQTLKIISILLFIMICTPQGLTLISNEEVVILKQEIPLSHVIENVSYISQTEGYFCYYASVAMILNKMGLNTSLEEIIFLDGIGYTHLYIESEKIIESSHYNSLDFVFDLFGVEENWWYPNRSFSDEQQWNIYYSHLKANISNNKPVITRVDPFSIGSLRDQFIIPEFLWNVLFPPSHHLVVIVGYNESNQSICYNDPNAGYYGLDIYGEYAWIGLSDFKKAVRLGAWSDYLLTTYTQTSLQYSKEERFEKAFKLNIKKLEGIYPIGQHSYGINASKELKKDFTDERRTKTIEIYKTRDDGGFNYLFYETMQKLLKFIFPNNPNIFDIIMVGQKNPFNTTSKIIKQIADFLEKNNYYQNLSLNQSFLLKQESILWYDLSEYFKVFMRKGLHISNLNAESLIEKMAIIVDKIINVEQEIINDGENYF